MPGAYDVLCEAQFDYFKSMIGYVCQTQWDYCRIMIDCKSVTSTGAITGYVRDPAVLLFAKVAPGSFTPSGTVCSSGSVSLLQHTDWYWWVQGGTTGVHSVLEYWAIVLMPSLTFRP
jgi:hypothetical protein